MVDIFHLVDVLADGKEVLYSLKIAKSAGETPFATNAENPHSPPGTMMPMTTLGGIGTIWYLTCPKTA